MRAKVSATLRHHAARHLGHRWFAFLEAPGGDLQAHLAIFHPQVRLTGQRGSLVFATDHGSLVSWFASIPDETSSHHILHSDYRDVDDDQGIFRMVVAYQTPGPDGVRGSVISYETVIDVSSEAPRFIALDKTPILPNTRAIYEPSWAVNRVLALVYASLSGLDGSSTDLRAAFSDDVHHVNALVSAEENARDYAASLVWSGKDNGQSGSLRLRFEDDGHAPFPELAEIELLRSVKDQT